MSRYSHGRGHKDGNHDEIVAVFDEYGATWDNTYQLPQLGYDGVLEYRGVVVKVEIKNPATRGQGGTHRKLKESEKRAMRESTGKYAVIETEQQAIRLLESIRYYAACIRENHLMLDWQNDDHYIKQLGGD